jgi:hypothetical protein
MPEKIEDGLRCAEKVMANGNNPSDAFESLQNKGAKREKQIQKR